MNRNRNGYTELENYLKENKITIYLDDQKTTEWNALYKENDEIGLLLGGKFKITTE